MNRGGKMPREFAWIDATKALPDDDLDVLVATSDENYPVWIGAHSGESWYWVTGVEIDDATVTHWAELPAPPDDDDTEGGDA